MFDIGSSELLLIIIVAVVVIGPKDLPRVLYKLGQVIGKGRAMTRHFRSGIDEMIRQAEMEEMEKKWAADNARIMAQTPPADPAPVLTDSTSVTPVTDVAPLADAPDGAVQAADDGYQPFVVQSAAPAPDIAPVRHGQPPVQHGPPDALDPAAPEKSENGQPENSQPENKGSAA